MSYEHTRRFDNVTDDELEPIRERFEEIADKFGLNDNWADGLLAEHRTALAKAYAVSGDDFLDVEELLSSDMDIDMQGSPRDGLSDEAEESIEKFAEWKWVGLFGVMPLEVAVMGELGQELAALTDEDLRDVYEASDDVQAQFDTFDAFRAKMNKVQQAYGMLNMVGGAVSDLMGSTMTYDTPPSVGETRVVQYVEPEEAVLGTYNLAEEDLSEAEAENIRTTEAEILGFEAPNDETKRALAHPNARVRIDGQEYILPPANVHAADGTAGQFSMTGIGGMLGDALGGDLDGMGGDLFDSGTDTDQFRVDDGDDEDDEDDDFGDLFDGGDFR